jgi:CheY-like chemotaxis protein
VEVAGNGKEALPKLIENPPEIVLLDLMMPELDGFEVVEALSSAGVTRPRIIVITAKALTPQEKSYLDKHVELIIKKGADDLIEVLERVMRDLDPK